MQQESVFAKRRASEFCVVAALRQLFDLRAKVFMLFEGQKQMVYMLADNFMGLPAEHAFGTAIPFGNLTLTVPQNKTERCRRIECPEP